MKERERQNKRKAKLEKIETTEGEVRENEPAKENASAKENAPIVLCSFASPSQYILHHFAGLPSPCFFAFP